MLNFIKYIESIQYIYTWWYGLRKRVTEPCTPGLFIEPLYVSMPVIKLGLDGALWIVPPRSAMLVAKVYSDSHPLQSFPVHTLISVVPHTSRHLGHI